MTPKILSTVLLLVIYLFFFTGCGLFYPTDDELNRDGYNEQGEKTCRCFTVLPTGRSCKCLKEVVTTESDVKEETSEQNK